MDVVLNAVQSVVSILIMVSVGYILAKKQWFHAHTSKLFSKLVVNVSLPALMVSNITTTFTREELTQSGVGLLIPFLVIFLSYLISLLAAKGFHIAPERRGVFSVMFAFSNTIFIGLPVNMALFGEESVMYVLFYYIANTTLFWTIGVHSISQDGNGRESILTLNTLKRIFSPPLTAFLAAVLLVLLDVPVPKFIADTSRYLGNMTTPVSMLFIGIVIYGIMSEKGVRVEKGMGVLLTGRFIVTPLLVFLVVSVLRIPIPDLMKNVFVIQSALPVMTQTAIIAEAYQADHRYAAVMVTISTLASLITIPVYMVILG